MLLLGWNRVYKWNPVARSDRLVFPTLNGHLTNDPVFNITITTMCCKENLMFVGEEEEEEEEGHKGYGFMNLPGNGITNYSPDKNLMCIVGDNTDALVVNLKSGEGK
ncbi:hypothetical protein SYNPS1DRAFT_25960 [Syncephalis pseudoplumigaleata]|uniref:Uncharacterized protein n=1 Tax=Syncephalis pseudoplumigaleata TaxID=1712513 RepID=A0A4V1J0Q1_9FUNG|nr:hypothetical protein SYNPS1DRAFT_25960 [Syncephalis pseudoplumigaleata]|eukprot:RKP22339.1 hypothetical protein SYNPS1DRAFT_25960 [Syncephalis pseudoplumigaleata]